MGTDYADDFGARLSGWLTPSVTGDYDLFTRSDDSSELHLSTDETAANLNWIAEEFECCEAFLEADDPDQRGQTASFFLSDLIRLEAGKQYYFEAYYKEGGGGDYMEVAWRIEGDTTPAASLPPIPGGFLSADADPNAPTTVMIVEQPVDVETIENLTATFMVAAAVTPEDNPPPIAYRWQKDGEDVPGGWSATYTTPALAVADDGSKYTCIVSIPGKSETSAEALLTVVADTFPPTVVSAAGLGEVIGICFDERLDETSASDNANYVLAGGAAVESAELQPDGQTVVLGVSGLAGATFTVVINNVEDLKGNPITADTQANGMIEAGLAAHDIGEPAISGSVYSCAPGRYVVTGGGDDFADNTGDQMFFVSETIAGDFDKRVRISSLVASIAGDDWARGGLMARGDNESDTSRAVKLVVGNPAGANQVTTRVRGQDGEPTAETGTGYSRPSRNYAGVADALPDQWIRLQRTGNNFNMYVGTDGENWAMIGERFVIDLPDSLEVGVYAAASTGPEEDPPAAGSMTTVAFENYSDAFVMDVTPPTLVSTGTLDKETVGVKFSETVDGTTAAEISHYGLSQGTVTAVEPGINGDSVYLMVSGLTVDDFTVTVNGVTDSAGNAIAPDSAISGSVSAWAGEDVGRFEDPEDRPQIGDAPYFIGKYVALSSGDNIEMDIMGDGANLWQGNYYHFAYVEKTGDFDVQVEVTRQTRSDQGGDYAHGGLMARDGLYLAGEEYTDDGNRTLYEMNTTYTEGTQERAALVLYRDVEGAAEGVGQIVGTGTQDANGWIGRFGKMIAGNARGEPLANTSPYANRWLRLQRAGDEFIHYWSYDGVNWTEYDRRERTDMSATLLVGYAQQINHSCCGGDSIVSKPGLYGQTNLRNFGDTQPPAPMLALDQTTYAQGDDMVATWRNGPGNATDWVGIYPPGVTPGDENGGVSPKL